MGSPDKKGQCLKLFVRSLAIQNIKTYMYKLVHLQLKYFHKILHHNILVVLKYYDIKNLNMEGILDKEILIQLLN